MPISRIYFDERGEPRARIIDEGGRYVVSIDVFKVVKSPPPDAEVIEIAGRYRVLTKKAPFKSGLCEYLYFQFYDETQLINLKYIGPDDPDVVVEELLKKIDEEVADSEK